MNYIASVQLIKLSALYMQWSSSLNCHFVVAKTFLPLIADKEGSSFTFITGKIANRNN